MNAIEHIDVGDVFVSSWGYEQTNVDFYKVTRKTRAMIELSPIPAVSKGETGWASDRVGPYLDGEPGAPIGLRRPKAYTYGGKIHINVGIDSVSAASKIDDPASYSTHRSWYA
jgi:hypothetical protein